MFKLFQTSENTNSDVKILEMLKMFDKNNSNSRFTYMLCLELSVLISRWILLGCYGDLA